MLALIKILRCLKTSSIFQILLPKILQILLKVNGEAPKLVPVFVTEKEKEEYCSLYKKILKEITTIIFNLIEHLDDGKAKLQREIFDKTVKKKKEEMYIEFLFKLHDDIDSPDGEIEVEI